MRIKCASGPQYWSITKISHEQEIFTFKRAQVGTSDRSNMKLAGQKKKTIKSPLIKIILQSVLSLIARLSRSCEKGGTLK